MADIEQAKEFLRGAVDAETNWRNEGLKALQFRYGDQWPEYAVASRGLERPKLTINETNAYCRKIANEQRKQRPRGKASPVDNFADKKVAKVITGLVRHIEVQSDADNAYDTAYNFSLTTGLGYWRLRTDYTRENSFDQEIYVDLVDNPFSVYFDWNARLPDGSDATRSLITKMMAREAYKQEYPGALDQPSFDARGAGDGDPTWFTDKEVRVAEFYYVERERAKLLMLTDGTVLWADEWARVADIAMAAGVAVKADRESFKRAVYWQKQSGSEVLSEKKLPGRWIPVIPVYWSRVVIDGKQRIDGVITDAKDPQIMLNFWQTAATEALALAPKAKWLIADGQDEGHENEFKNANLSPAATLRYKPTDVDGKPVPPPQRIQPEAPPAGMIEATFEARNNLSRVMGVFDPAVRGGAQHKSDRTLNAERSQSDMTNFDGYDNLIRSMKHSYRVMLSWFPAVYDTRRVQRIIGEDGKEEVVTLNDRQQVPGPDGQAIERVLNDVTVGEYDVVMEAGPGYDTQRKEGSAAMIELATTPLGQMVAQSSADLVVRGFDFPGADLIADRLAAANPLSKIDEQSDVPPQAQMMIKQLQQQLQQAGQIIQGLQLEQKYRGGIEQMKQEGATKRTLLQETGSAHDTETRAQSDRAESEGDNQTKLIIEEMKAQTALMLKHMDERIQVKMAEHKAASGNGAAPSVQ